MHNKIGIDFYSPFLRKMWATQSMLNNTGFNPQKHFKKKEKIRGGIARGEKVRGE